MRTEIAERRDRMRDENFLPIVPQSSEVVVVPEPEVRAVPILNGADDSVPETLRSEEHPAHSGVLTLADTTRRRNDAR